MKKCPDCQNTYPTGNAYCPLDGTPLAVLDGLTPGTTIRRKYRIIEEIGSGGMGVVYRAHHLKLKKDCALKVVNARFASDPQVVERFLAEAMMANRVRHPNVVHVEDADETEDGQPFVVMEYVAGKSLRQIMHPVRDADPVLPDLLRALDIACQVLDGLAAAHLQRIIHRDIKPDNILITTKEDGRELVKIVDFGIAKAKEQLLDRSIHTLTGMFIGTPQYCSPEHAKGAGGDQLDERTDIYSLGVVLYEMLTGWPPFSGDPHAILEQHQRTAPPHPQTMRPDLSFPDTVVHVVMKALSKDPGSRYSTAEEMRTALRAAPPLLNPVEDAPPQENSIIETVKLGNPARPDLVDPERSDKPTTAPPKFESGVQPSGASTTPRTWVLALVLLLVIAAGAALLVYRRSLDQTAAAHTRVQVQETLAKGKQAQEKGSFDDAIRLYREVLGLEPDNQEAKSGIEAAETAKAEIARKVREADQLLREAEEFRGRGEYDKAIAAFLRVLDADTNNQSARTGIRAAQSAKAAEERVSQ